MTKEDIARLSKANRRRNDGALTPARRATYIAVGLLIVPLAAVGLGCLLALLLAPTVYLIQHIFFE